MTLLFSAWFHSMHSDYGHEADVIFDDSNSTCIGGLYDTPEDVAIIGQIELELYTGMQKHQSINMSKNGLFEMLYVAGR